MAKRNVQQSSMTRTVDGQVVREAKDEEGSGRGKFYWWKSNKDGQEDQLAEEQASTIKFIAKHQSTRVEQLTVSTRLYGNNSAYNMLGAAFTRSSAATSTPSASRISFNLCASVIDTLTAQIAKNKVVPTFITSGGVWGMQRKAENLSKFTEGIFYEHNVHEKITYQFRDAGCWGDGILHVYRDANDRAAVERVLPHELLVDLVESIVGKPMQMHRIKIADRGIVAANFPEHEAEIMKAMPSSYSDLGGDGSAADLITVAESWHLPSGPDTDDGLHIITLLDNNKLLFREEWKKNYFPFVILPYSKRLLGFWGQGACERLQNIQGEINRGMITIQKAHWLMAGPKIFLGVDSKIVPQHINNELGAIITGTTPPQYLVPPMIQEQVYTWVDSLIAKGYQQEGVSQLSANNVKPLGINSGTALRTYDTIAEDRQLFIAQRVESAALEVARQAIEVVKEVYKDKKTYKVNYPNTNFVEQIDWKDVNLEMDEYWLKAFPTSELPEEPAAKLQTVQEYMQAGLISPRAGRRLLSMPDVEMSDKLANAAEELICKSIEEMLYDGEKDIVPDAEWDLSLAQDLCMQYLNYAKLNNCPENNLNLLREFKSQVDDQLGLTMSSMPQPSPMANPQPTPQNDMVQNTAMPTGAVQ